MKKVNYQKWFSENTQSLEGKSIAITGATGGLGAELCEHLAALGAHLILLNRSKVKTDALIEKLHLKFPTLKVSFIPLELEDLQSVNSAVTELGKMDIDILIHNAGAYSIPRKKTALGVDNVFQINFLSPVYMTCGLLDTLKNKGGKVVIVGSIAHNYSKTRQKDIDFADCKADSKVYGNAKRRLMLWAYEKFKNEKQVSLSVVHPGITFTNITAHYSKLIFAIIKNPMKVIFMKPKKAALCIVKGIFENCGYAEWIGPRLFGIWGLPRKTVLKTFEPTEAKMVYENANRLLKDVYNNEEV